MVSELKSGGGGKVKQKSTPGSGSSALKDLDTEGWGQQMGSQVVIKRAKHSYRCGWAGKIIKDLIKPGLDPEHSGSHRKVLSRRVTLF